MSPGNTSTVHRGRLKWWMAISAVLIIITLVARGYWIKDQQFLAKRDWLVKQAFSDIRDGYAKLRGQFPQLQKIYLLAYVLPLDSRDRQDIPLPGILFAAHSSFRVELSYSPAVPTGMRMEIDPPPPTECWFSVATYPYSRGLWSDDRKQPSILFPNLKLEYRQLNCGALDPALNAALKNLLRDALNPLREFDAMSGPLKAPEVIGDFHWNESPITTTAPATTQP